VRVVVRDQGGDQLPATGQILTYVMDMSPLGPEEAVALERECAGDLRLATYNVHDDGLWDPGVQEGFRRQLVAAAPDIVSFQEVFGHSPAQTRALMMAWLPPEPGGDWHAAGNDDCKTASRHPILQSWAIDGNLAVLIDTSPVLGAALLLIHAHLPCCDNDARRQEEIDAILAFLRDALQPGGPVTVAPGTAVVITGDLNLVGLAQQLESLLSGDVVNEGAYGPDFAPDWDGTGLTRLLSRQTERRMGYTWRNDQSSFWPGHLDYMILGDSVVETGRTFILYTPEMSPEHLARYGLQSGDSLASDHLLLCADIRPVSLPGDVNDDGVVDIADLVALIVSWGPCPPPCPADLDKSGAVDVGDLVIVLVSWT
jgi:endonuclease/exonuclease/phosphatase family metal-dependent hydrolase